MIRLPAPLILALLVAGCGPKNPDDAADESTTTPFTSGADSADDTTTAPLTTTTADPPTTTTVDTATSTTEPATDTTADTGDTAQDEQTPPQGRLAVEAWLAEGHYKNWSCQASVHDPIPISPHGKQRVCSNDLVSAHPPDGGEYPVGSAGVKELYDADGLAIVGYAVYLHTAVGTGGDTWYWYERVPLDSPAPHDEDGVVADGLGTSGPAMNICVACHQATGIDADHPGHDFVYTQVQ